LRRSKARWESTRKFAAPSLQLQCPSLLFISTDPGPRNARIDFHVVSWDYAQTFPYQGDQPIDESDEKKAQASTNKGPVSFSWEVDVNGEITAHMSVSPLYLSIAVGSVHAVPVKLTLRCN